MFGLFEKLLSMFGELMTLIVAIGLANGSAKNLIVNTVTIVKKPKQVFKSSSAGDMLATLVIYTIFIVPVTAIANHVIFSDTHAWGLF